MLPFLWPLEAITLFASFLFLALMFAFPGWGLFVGFLVTALAFYGLVQLREHLEVTP